MSSCSITKNTAVHTYTHLTVPKPQTQKYHSIIKLKLF